MGNRVNITVAGRDYTLVAEDAAEYVEKVAAHVDAKLSALTHDKRLSLADAAILTAVNLADEYFKEAEAMENLRTQMKSYLEESARAKLELAEAKREIFKLQNEKK